MRVLKPWPWALGRKHPNAGREWGWQWAFPASYTHVLKRGPAAIAQRLHVSDIEEILIPRGESAAHTGGNLVSCWHRGHCMPPSGVGAGEGQNRVGRD